jgi:hypothetical protein
MTDVDSWIADAEKEAVEKEGQTKARSGMRVINGGKAAPADDDKPISPTRFKLRPANEVPRREWIYDNHVIRRFASLTAGPGGGGKSSDILIEGLAVATGRPLLGVHPVARGRVWYWNGEDPQEETERRVAAACQHYGISAEELDGWFFTDSGRDLPIDVASIKRGEIVVDDALRDGIAAAITEAKIDWLILDPFIATHTVPENLNTEMKKAGKVFVDIADETNCAVEIVHHVTKSNAIGDDSGIYGARGAGALIDLVRSARILKPMDADTAAKLGIEDYEGTFSIAKGKANLAKKDQRVAAWRRMIGVGLPNGTEDLPGDDVGVCTAWTPPDVMEGLTAKDLRAVQMAINAVSSPPKENERAADWVGYVVASTLGLDVGEGLTKAERNGLQNAGRAKVRAFLKAWAKSEALVSDTIHDSRRGCDVKVIVVGDWVTPDEC